MRADRVLEEARFLVWKTRLECVRSRTMIRASHASTLDMSRAAVRTHDLIAKALGRICRHEAR